MKCFFQVWASLSVAEQEHFLNTSEESRKLQVVGLEKAEAFKSGKQSYSEVLRTLLTEVRLEVKN